MTKAGKSQNPAYPDANPTAPGGMSEKALVAELRRDTTFTADYIAALSWPEKINHVIASRQAKDMTAVEPEPTHTAEPDEFDDLDDMLAEFGLIEAEQAAEPITLPVCEGVDMVLIDTSATPSTESKSMLVHPDDCEHECCAGPQPAPDEAVLDVDPEWMDPEQMFAEMAKARAAEEATKPPPIFIGIPGVKDYIFEGHAGAGPSGAERWMNCTMSLSASREFLETLSPNQQAQFAGASTAARQGTTAHNAAEAEANMILGRASAEEVEHTLLELSLVPADEGEAYDDDMAEYIIEYTDLVKSYAQERGDDHVMIESRVEAAIPLADLHEGEVYVIRGSADCAVLPTKSERDLVVADLKYGNGIDVDVDENPQIRIYALGVLGLLSDDEGELITPVDTVTYYIVQPRLGGIKAWSETLDDLLAWRDEVLSPALTKALYGAAEGATYEPSELACQFCPARGRCPALTEARVEAAAGLFDTIVEAEFEHGPGAFPETTSLTDTRLGELLTMVAGLKNIYDDLRDEAQRRLHRGGSVPGYQLVSYTPARKWHPSAQDVIAAGENLSLSAEHREALFKEPVLITPTQAEKVLGKEMYAQVEALVEKPAKRPVIAPVGDRRTTWTGTPPEQLFPDTDVDGGGDDV